MIKRKNKNKNSKGQLFIVGSFLILFGVIMIGSKVLNNYTDKKDEEKLIQDFYEQDYITDDSIVEEEIIEEVVQNENVTINYIAVIKIPKIGLEKGLANKGSYYNNVNRNIEILNESDMPDVDKGNVILASHSGNSQVSYFRKLNRLQNDDIVSIFYNGKEYKYKMVNSYEVEKDGTASILRNAEKNTLTLITCKQNTNKQIVVICELVETV